MFSKNTFLHYRKLDSNNDRKNIKIYECCKSTKQKKIIFHPLIKYYWHYPNILLSFPGNLFENYKLARKGSNFFNNEDIRKYKIIYIGKTAKDQPKHARSK